ncbi:ribosomal RNA-processing protein 7 homolog A-like isoform X1 [Amphibalanus amphitrite]|uniref:ribosomal RNA-processing protein 7 homolog A-like isoform X1 n=2 Tax=Amphibalanus amphitrite TaxID=1232801 RepID=UPI001C913DAB|nr:ribosomal RNA-processing protein 7 homolog A-like isoform X1 [Amphibalanus amphitrite]XP_043208888.1 ribosomal RNA-processing protein 7 homolog A-like isoform X1 [Amphibalanus amphitrite]
MDFKVLPVKFSEQSEAVHYLFYKQHTVRSPVPEKPSDRTLFVINVLPYMDEASLKRLFRDCGKVRRVYIHKKPTPGLPEADSSRFFPTVEPVVGYKVAYCVFTKPEGLQKALSLDLSAESAPRVLSTEQHPLQVGVVKWQQEYNDSVLDEEALKKEVDEYMAEHDARVAEEIQKARAQEGQPDSDGWVLVTRHSKRPVARRTEGLDQRLKEKMKKKRQRQQMVNLYNFQLKDTKMEQLAKLREKFEEDKRKIASMRVQRKFRPY